MPTGVYKRKKEDIEKLLKNSGNKKGNKWPESVKKKISESHKKIGSPWNIGNNWNIGRVRPYEERLKISQTLKKNKNHLWKGGVYPINKLIRCSLEYKLWREAVFKRDNYTCVFCKEVGGKLNADHIKPFAYFPELRFAIDNGRTLCHQCHKKTDTYGRKGQIKYKQIKL